MFLELLASILPEGILDNFKVTDVKKGSQFLEIYLEEKYLLEGFEEGIKVHSKGFHKDIVIKDFPSVIAVFYCMFAAEDGKIHKPQKRLNEISVSLLRERECKR